MRMGELAGAAGRGMVAGVAGTAAITASMTLESKLRHKPEPTAAGEAAERILGIKPAGEPERLRLSRVVHWMYGTGWGAVRGVLAEAGLSERPATAIHYAAISLTAMVVPPALGVMPPPTELPPKEVGLSALHHLAYALAAAAAWRALDNGRRSAR
jgi:hypothetical protein